MTKPRVVETEEGIQGEFNVEIYILPIPCLLYVALWTIWHTATAQDTFWIIKEPALHHFVDI